jgi:mannose-1-phosphate guanylyltransferase
MDAIILVGGHGTRLRPLTLTRHKSLVPICNRPAIEYLFGWLERAGFERAVLAIGQHNEDLADAYRGGRPGRLRVDLVEERERLESGGAIRHAVREAGIEGRFLVLNGDVFVDFDFEPVLQRHIDAKADLTLVLYDVPDPSAFGVAITGEDGFVTGFVEKPPPGTAPSTLVNAGAWIFEPGLVAEIPPGAVRVEETLFPSLVARRRRVLGQEVRGIWADIGTPARYLALNHALLARDGRENELATCTIDPRASVSGSVVGLGCVVGPGAVVERSVLWERVRIASGAQVRDSVLADGVTVGEDARLEGAVVGSRAHITAGTVIGPGTLIEPAATYDGNHE